MNLNLYINYYPGIIISFTKSFETMEYLPSDKDIVLGEGTYGKVFKVKGPDDKYYAVKVPTFDQEDPNSVWIYEGFVTEGSVLSLLSGLDGIVNPKAVSYYPPLIALEMYPMDGNAFGQHILEQLNSGAVDIGDIDDMTGLHPNIVELLTTTYMKKKRFLYSCLVGLNNQFSHGIIHRDIKPGNMLGDNTGKFVIADYGLAENELYPGANKSTNVYTQPFRPPEVFNDDELYDLSGDIWALGISYYYISVGRTVKSMGDIIKLVGIEAYIEYEKSRFLANKTITNKDDFDLDVMMVMITDYEKLNQLLSNLDIYGGGLSDNVRISYRQYLIERWGFPKGDNLEEFIDLCMDVITLYRKSLGSRLYDLETCVKGKLLTIEEADVLRLMLQINPDDRPTPAQIYNHSFFDDLRKSGDLPYPDDDLKATLDNHLKLSRIVYRKGGRMDYLYGKPTFDYYIELDNNLDRSCLPYDTTKYMAQPLEYINNLVREEDLIISKEIICNYLYMFSLLCIDIYTEVQLEAILFLSSVIVSGESILSDDNPISMELYSAIEEIQSNSKLPRYMNIVLMFNYYCNDKFRRLPSKSELSELVALLSTGNHISHTILETFNTALGVVSSSLE